MFWTDIDQANQRLRGAVVMYDGLPVYVERVYTSDDTGDPSALVRTVADGNLKEISLEDEKWNNFRDCPPVGFINTPKRLYQIKRYPNRTMRHGLTGENTSVRYLAASRKWGLADIRVSSFITDRSLSKYYKLRVEEGFPSFQQCLEVIRDSDDSSLTLAFSPLHYLYREENGIFTVVRGDQRIGFVVRNEIFLERKFYCFKEELEEEHNVQNIMEA